MVVVTNTATAQAETAPLATGLAYVARREGSGFSEDAQAWEKIWRQSLCLVRVTEIHRLCTGS